MTRYFFHVRNGDQVSHDLEGQELPDLEAARHEAVSVNREMLGERLLHGGSMDSRRIEIADSEGEVLATVTADDVLFKDGQKNGQLRSFDDDVTQSAPVANPISQKPPRS